MSTHWLLDAHDLHAWYGVSHVLHGVALQVAAGETVGLLGRNGMGKSTLLRTICGHVQRRCGRIAIAGRDCSRARPHEVARAGVAYVPEGRGIFASLTVRENLLLGERNARGAGRRWTRARVFELFPRLVPRLAHSGAQLSGGEQQMLSIGRALLTQPHLLLLDEATEGLAPLVVADIWRVLREISADGIATVVIDRNYRQVAAHAARLVVLQKGSVALTCAGADIGRDPSLSLRLAALLGV